MENQDRFENVFAIADLKGYNIKTLLVLVGIKMKIVLDLKKFSDLLAFEEELRKSDVGKEVVNDKSIMKLIRERIIGKSDLKEREASRFVRQVLHTQLLKYFRFS